MRRWLVYQRGLVHAWDVQDAGLPMATEVIQVNVPSRDGGTCYFKFDGEWLIMTEELWGGPITPEKVEFIESAAISTGESGDGSPDGVTAEKIAKFADKHGLFSAKPGDRIARWREAFGK